MATTTGPRWSVTITVREVEGGRIREIGPYWFRAPSRQEAEWAATMAAPKRYRVLMATAEAVAAEDDEAADFLDCLAQQQNADVRHPDTIGVYRTPEPKSIYSPAPKGRITREPPRKRRAPDPRDADGISPTHKVSLMHPNVSRSVDGHTQRFYRVS